MLRIIKFTDNPYQQKQVLNYDKVIFIPNEKLLRISIFKLEQLYSIIILL